MSILHKTSFHNSNLYERLFIIMHVDTRGISACGNRYTFDDINIHTSVK